ncbi:hypothetical protein FF1_040696 [Malus domestica]
MPNGSSSFGMQVSGFSQGTVSDSGSLPFPLISIPVSSTMPLMYPQVLGNQFFSSSTCFLGYSEFPNAYGFMGNVAAPRQFSNTNGSPRSFRPNNNGNGNESFRSSQGGNNTSHGRGQSSGTRQNNDN